MHPNGITLGHRRGAALKGKHPLAAPKLRITCCRDVPRSNIALRSNTALISDAKQHWRSPSNLQLSSSSPFACQSSSSSRINVTGPVEGTVAPDARDAAADWLSFLSNWSGEWEGVTATFTADGAPQPLPHLYVPDAFREWGVELFDWQSQCSCKPGTAAGEASYVVRRLMPTVGCEADAVASTDQHAHVWRPDEFTQWGQLPVLADGSFAAGPLQLDSDSGRAVLEACLVKQTQQERLRVVCTLAPHWQHKTWQPLQVEVHKEQYDGPYNNGQDLRSCGFRMQPLSPEPVLQQADVSEGWAAQPGGVHLRRESAGEPLSVSGTGAPTRWSAPEEPSVAFLGLPGGAYCKVQCSNDNSSLWVELGALQGQPRTLKAARYVFRDGVLTEVLLGCDTKSS